MPCVKIALPHSSTRPPSSLSRLLRTSWPFLRLFDHLQLFFSFCIYLCARIFLDITSRGPSFRRGLFSPSFVFSIYRFFVRVLCHDVLGCISLCMSLIVYDLCVCVCGRGGRVRMICCFDFLFVSFLSPFFFFSLLLIYFVTSVPCLCCLVV